MTPDNNFVELGVALKEKARSLGFSMVGVVEARPGRRLAAYHEWIANLYHGEMGWMARPDRIARRENLEMILPGIRSIVSVGLDYGSDPIPEDIAGDPSRGRFSNYAWGVDYHQLMAPRLQTLAAWLTENSGKEVETKVYVDTGAILERDHAESAGLGFTGKNSMLINPKRGSWFFLGELLTTAELTPDIISQQPPSCGSCTRCLGACPTAAFPKPYVLDARRCISYLTIELKGWIPRELRPLMGNWVYGCDICQEVCPFNRFSKGTAVSDFIPPDWDTTAPNLVEILSLQEDSFLQRYSGTPIERIGRGRLVRNGCIAAGNWGSQEVVPALVPLLRDSYALIRGHAAWALGRIRGGNTVVALRKAYIVEQDPLVRSEMETALSQ